MPCDPICDQIGLEFGQAGQMVRISLPLAVLKSKLRPV
jgi:hypothetical protein